MMGEDGEDKDDEGGPSGRKRMERQEARMEKQDGVVGWCLVNRCMQSLL